MLKKLKYNCQKINAICKSKVYRNGIKSYWWNEKKNFGDLLTPEIMSRLGYTAIHSYFEGRNAAEWIFVGSLIQLLPNDFSGNIIGTGLISEKYHSLPNANIISVRGELTKKTLGLDNNVKTGDMGLISDLLVNKNKTKKKYSFGIIPHYIDKNNMYIADFMKKNKSRALCIDVERKAESVVNDIANCELIISSSLHGIVVADSLNIPNVWVNLSENVIGNGFKFFDYNSSIDYEQEPYDYKILQNIKNLKKIASVKNRFIINEKKNEIINILNNTLTR